MALARLKKYNAKRDFTKTPEPSGKAARVSPARRYLIQKHDASHMHYDFRLEHDGVLLSWAIPRGPSMDPADKRLAVHVEDHPIAYGDFEGTIPKGQYGGGTVMLWDIGHWAPLGDVDESMRKGDLKFAVLGKRLKGGFALVRLKNNKYGKGDNWLLIKENDPYAKPGGKPVIEGNLRSAKSGRTMEEIARGNSVWHSNQPDGKDPAAKPGKKATKKTSKPLVTTKKRATKSVRNSVKKKAAAKKTKPARVSVAKKARRAR
jgi:bifunctional non-homologous end joining protein LigD